MSTFGQEVARQTLTPTAADLSFPRQRDRKRAAPRDPGTRGAHRGVARRVCEEQLWVVSPSRKARGESPVWGDTAQRPSHQKQSQGYKTDTTRTVLHATARSHSRESHPHSDLSHAHDARVTAQVLSAFQSSQTQ